jgi:hypothetical protein
MKIIKKCFLSANHMNILNQFSSSVNEIWIEFDSIFFIFFFSVDVYVFVGYGG